MKLAIILFNLGGPDSPEAVEPFLRNLFSDPAIIRAPAPIRFVLSELLSRGREKTAVANYAVLGGGSPLLAETHAQAEALQTALSAAFPGDKVRCFIAMRYWRPFTQDAARAVADFVPDQIVLLPLYPQFSTTTTESSLAAWREAYAGPGVQTTVCCYFDDEALVAAHAALIDTHLVHAEIQLPLRSHAQKILLHGHCHQKALVGAQHTQAALAMIPGATVQLIDSGCCGMAGSFGYEHYEISMAIGERVLFKAVRNAPDATLIAPGFSCRHQIEHGTGRKAKHPLELIAEHLGNA